MKITKTKLKSIWQRLLWFANEYAPWPRYEQEVERLCQENGVQYEKPTGYLFTETGVAPFWEPEKQTLSTHHKETVR